MDRITITPLTGCRGRKWKKKLAKQRARAKQKGVSNTASKNIPKIQGVLRSRMKEGEKGLLVASIKKIFVSIGGQVSELTAIKT